MSQSEPALIVDGQEFACTWGAICGLQHYRVDVTLAAHGHTLPPAWMTFMFADAARDGVLSADNFVQGAGPHVGQFACEFERVELTAIGELAYALLANEQAGVVAKALTVEHFAGRSRKRKRRR